MSNVTNRIATVITPKSSFVTRHSSFHSDAFGQVARFIDVAPAHHGNVIRQELERYRSQEGLQALQSVRNVNHVVRLLQDFSVSFGGDSNHGSAARPHLFDVGY